MIIGTLQVGGSDQMGNMVSGHELVSKMGLEEVFGWYSYKINRNLRLKMWKFIFSL